RAWANPDFWAHLRSAPRATLEEAGMALPAKIEVELVEDTETAGLALPADIEMGFIQDMSNRVLLMIPQPPSWASLSEEEVLDNVFSVGIFAGASRWTISGCTECCKTKHTSNYCCT
ncbi:MAG: hypothetical protein KGI30_11005, partial [Planctomycetota bacterium]|nr:hypothetical protein [Planctomycetota bacterium]